MMTMMQSRMNQLHGKILKLLFSYSFIKNYSRQKAKKPTKDKDTDDSPIQSEPKTKAKKSTKDKDTDDSLVQPEPSVIPKPEQKVKPNKTESPE